MIFDNAKIGDKVVLVRNGTDESTQRICDITAKTIRVRSCNLYRFKRNGELWKQDSRDGVIDLKIRPVDKADL